MARKKTVSKTAEEILSFDYIDDAECGISENTAPVGKVVESFSFNDNVIETKEESADKPQASEKLIDNRRLQKQPYGITPPVDGEYFEIRRTFLFRRSTVRMLNKLKAEHEDENVYLSSIVDEAIRWYYKFIFLK